MQISQRNLNKIMRIENLPRRKAKLEEFLLSLGWHGGIWQEAKREWVRLSEMGVKTPLESRYDSEA